MDETSLLLTEVHLKCTVAGNSNPRRKSTGFIQRLWFICCLRLFIPSIIFIFYWENLLEIASQEESRSQRRSGSTTLLLIKDHVHWDLLSKNFNVCFCQESIKGCETHTSFINRPVASWDIRRNQTTQPVTETCGGHASCVHFLKSLQRTLVCVCVYIQGHAWSELISESKQSDPVQPQRRFISVFSC